MKNFMKILSCMVATVIISSCNATEEITTTTTTETTTEKTIVSTKDTTKATSKEFVTTSNKSEAISTYDIDIPATESIIPIEKDYIEPESENNFFIKGNTNSAVNFRNTPSTKDTQNIIRVLSPNTEVLVTNINTSNDFIKIYINEEVGYIKKEFIDLKEIELYAIKDTKIKDTLIHKGKKITLYEGKNNSFYDETFSPVSIISEDFKDKKEYLNSQLKTANFELISSFDTYYSYEEQYLNKAYNINLCCTEVTTIIPANDNFNWFEVVGNTGKEEGYKLANTYSAGKVVQGYGGGVCQVASTIYNCVLNLDMEVIERHAHGLPVNYVDWYNQKDATVGDIGGPNFIFKNNLGFDIYIKAYTTEIPENDITQRGKLTVEFYKISW